MLEKLLMLFGFYDGSQNDDCDIYDDDSLLVIGDDYEDYDDSIYVVGDDYDY